MNDLDALIADTSYRQNAVLRDIAVIEATGIRISELCTLTLPQVDLNSHKIIIYGKGARERMIQVTNSDVQRILNEYYATFEEDIRSTGWFFINRLHRRYSEQSVRSMIAKYLNLAAIDLHITPHMFRHSFATFILYLNNSRPSCLDIQVNILDNIIFTSRMQSLLRESDRPRPFFVINHIEQCQRTLITHLN